MAIKKLPEILPQGYKPSSKEPYMNNNQLKYFELKLKSWESEILDGNRDAINNLESENWHEADFNDRVTVESGAALMLRKKDRERKLLDKIRQALQRIYNGEYGYCKETGDPIGLKRLEARPTAEYTIEAQEKHENYEKQHNEDED